MQQLTDRDYLRTDQYADATNLNARASLHQRFSTNAHPWHRWVFDQFDLQARCHVLDLGSGPGDLWLENRDRIPRGWAIVLADLSPAMLHKARPRLASRDARFAYRVVDAQSIPYPDGTFHQVVANHMLYHVPNRERALCEIHRVLRPGGQLYAATNGLHHMKELRELLTSTCRDFETPQVATQFGLENGTEQLSQCFDRVGLYRQQNELVVTEAEPLLAYARSMLGEAVVQDDVDALSRKIRREIGTRGAIHIQKDAGLFKATKL